MEQDQAAEEADVSRLEEQWRATTEERYFGAMAQVSAARRKSSQEPGNIIAWLRLAQLLLQGGGGEGRASVSQDLALNALSNGLDANVCSLDLWLAYLEVLRRKDGDEAAEMLEVAVQKVPLALSLWHRLASAQPSVQMRLGVWQRAVESAAAMLVPDKQLVDMGVGLASGWRQALAMWLQAQIAGAATLTLALRPAEASSLLARAASRLPLVLGIHFDPCAWEGDGDGKHAVESAEEGARGSIGEREWSPEEVEREADKWKVALPVIETLCLLSVQVVSAGAMLHSSTCPSVLQGRTPSTRFCGAGAGAELIVAAAAHSAHVNIHAPSARQSPPWTYAAVCLSSLTPIPDNSEDNGARQQSVGEDNAAAIEAVEHASYLWRRCVASARRVGAGCDESGVSPVLAEHYVTLMRRASPFRGACTARQRILACAPLGFARTPAPGFSLGAAASTASADAARPGIQQSADAARPGVQQSQRTARSVGSWFPDAAELVGPLGKVKATSCKACHKVGHDKFECPAFFFKTFNQAMPGHSQDGLKLPNYWHDNNPQNGPAGWVAEGWIQQSWLTSQTLAGSESLKPTGLGTDAWRAWANRPKGKASQAKPAAAAEEAGTEQAASRTELSKKQRKRLRQKAAEEAQAKKGHGPRLLAGLVKNFNRNLLETGGGGGGSSEKQHGPAGCNLFVYHENEKKTDGKFYEKKTDGNPDNPQECTRSGCDANSECYFSHAGKPWNADGGNARYPKSEKRDAGERGTLGDLVVAAAPERRAGGAAQPGIARVPPSAPPPKPAAAAASGQQPRALAEGQGTPKRGLAVGASNKCAWVAAPQATPQAPAQASTAPATSQASGAPPAARNSNVQQGTPDTSRATPAPAAVPAHKATAESGQQPWAQSKAGASAMLPVATEHE